MVRIMENEGKILQALEKLDGRGQINQVAKESNLAHVAVMRGVLSLTAKKLIKVHEKKETTVLLNEEGKEYARKGLPERNIIDLLIRLGGEASIDEIAKQAGMNHEGFKIAVGWLRHKNWVVMKKKERILRISKEPVIETDEKLIHLLEEEGPTLMGQLGEEMKAIVPILERRKLLKTKEKTLRELELTKRGWNLVKQGIEVVKEVSQLTSKLIRTGEWSKIRLKRFDVTAPGQVVYPGKAHPVQRIIQRIKEIFREMGFTETRGPIVETAFWNFDALFQPQDHPAREMVDTFYLAHPKEGRLPGGQVVENVANTHENGWITGSRGWEYVWRPEEAKRLILRTHTTSATIRYLVEHKEPPVKAFSVDRVYRNEKVDYKHLAEFHQIEGIIMDKNVTLRDLMGTLKEFYLKLGLKKVQFWPSYFPYTEPSIQSTVYIPELKTWVELCGMGIFRPEVLEPLGIKYPVLAWGGGLERLIMLKLDVGDIRFLYKNNLGWLRRSPISR